MADGDSLAALGSSGSLFRFWPDGAHFDDVGFHGDRSRPAGLGGTVFGIREVYLPLVVNPAVNISSEQADSGGQEQQKCTDSNCSGHMDFPVLSGIVLTGPECTLFFWAVQ